MIWSYILKEVVYKLEFMCLEFQLLHKPVFKCFQLTVRYKYIIISDVRTNHHLSSHVYIMRYVRGSQTL
jgi:hypothetical protein